MCSEGREHEGNGGCRGSKGSKEDGGNNGNGGVVFNVQRFSLVDGPGVRTTVFFKGCNLRCRWCHNPESFSPLPQLCYDVGKCIRCGSCIKSCPRQCLREETQHCQEETQYCQEKEKEVFQGKRQQCQGEVRRRRVERDLVGRIGYGLRDCVLCGRCTDHCYAKALSWIGQEITAADLMEELLEDFLYYQRSGGGVTFSGGECMLQIDFLEEILGRCHREGIHTAVDTAGNVPFEYFERILPVTDLFLYDMKAFHEEVHRKLTGVSNERIIENLVWLKRAGKKIVVRIPVIPGVNEEELAYIRDFLDEYGLMDREVLAYHNMGVGKSELLLTPVEQESFQEPSQEQMVEYQKILITV